MYKLLTSNLVHYNHRYKLGLNVLQDKFNYNNDYGPGGFYFCKFNNIVEWLTYNDDLKYICEVELCEDSQVVIYENKIKADKIILKNIKLITNFLDEKCLQYEAVHKDGYNLKYIENQSELICILAVTNNGNGLQFVKNQTENICLAAVKQYGLSLQYVENQTEKICMQAVKVNGLALEYVKNKTYKICKAALDNYYLAKVFIKNYDIEYNNIHKNNIEYEGW